MDTDRDIDMIWMWMKQIDIYVVPYVAQIQIQKQVIDPIGIHTPFFLSVQYS